MREGSDEIRNHNTSRRRKTMASLNRVTLIGNLGKDPEQKTVGEGKLVTFSMATTDAWTDHDSGERKEATQWHNIAIWNATLAEVAMDFLKKGSRAFVEGRLETRSWEKDGQKHYATEVVIRPYNGQLILLDKAERPTDHPLQRRDRAAEPRR
jgi:single-strand DNA-binding protein